MIYKGVSVSYIMGLRPTRFLFESLAACAHVLFAMWCCCIASYCDSFFRLREENGGCYCVWDRINFRCVSFHRGLISGHFVTSCVFEVHIVHYMRLSL